MAKMQQPERAYGDFLFKGYINPNDMERPPATRGGGKIAVFANKNDPLKEIHFTERDILRTLHLVETSAVQGAYRGRPVHHLFNAVRAGFPLHPAIMTCPIKPENLYMLLDGMYGGKTMRVGSLDFDGA